ncbi:MULTISPECIES: ClpXP protease specificity-enhancing factor [Proteus]|jgi:stringent starvation protein B|uniref:Stringent starvation protein B n=1 Tax=Proteus vulgaris TaxID=585 RepID=A0A379F7X0_PROVU|nr:MULTISPECIES: ClpXP protease specificity-enhancing factor [Proteus]NBN59537.1 ClpXP protease specificity-enhancing factor [Proteus sp. G2639]RNT25988.1 ClpXP protease specificity-enhancing factor [Proteus mirabilis]AYY79415.1 ClpXP protease specificity-enhancing factor [Proteus vulgaris]KGA56687.1 stringent starvation protein B [Proteus vulgaris]MBG5970602.1 ClpXP protease specificity-enhancing factor [Proteus vulgaris]
MEIMDMSPRRPHLLRAHYDWIIENELTPHLVVDVNIEGVQVPMEYAHDGQIVLNISSRAVDNLELTPYQVLFSASFGGIPRKVRVPMAAVMAIYARENGAGMMFEPEPAYESGASLQFAEDESEERTLTPVNEGLSLVTDETVETDISSPDDDPEPPRPTGRPALRVVK